MNTQYRHLTLAIAMVGLTASGSLFAQEQNPVAKDSAASCDSMNWHKDAIAKYPDVIAACQEVVIAQDGSKWARFGSSFDRREVDGTLVLGIQGPNKQRIQEVTLTPGADQLVNINGRDTEFRNLDNGQALYLYMPENSSGFTTKVGVMPNGIASTRNNEEYGSEDSKQLDQSVVTLDNVQFTLNSAELTPAAKLILDEHAREFSTNANTKYLISGHASASASQEYNQQLSERRAKAAMDYLVDVGGVDASLLSTVGHGEMRPIAREDTDGASNSKEAQANMRVGFETLQVQAKL